MNEQHHFQVQLQGTMTRILIAALLTILSIPAPADQKAIPSYGAAGKKAYALYAGVAPRDSTDIYCGIRFKVDPADPKRPTDWLSLEHAYPADWMADQFCWPAGPGSGEGHVGNAERGSAAVAC